MEEIIKKLSNLSPEEKKKVVQYLIKEKQKKDCIYPQTFAQQRLWFLNQMDGTSNAYNVCSEMKLEGSLDIAVLNKALEVLEQRHDILRTTFSMRNNEPVQGVRYNIEIPFQEIDISNLTVNDKIDQANKLVNNEAKRIFDLEKGPLYNITLIKIDKTSYILVLVMHHIVTDAWSTMILTRELAEAYAAILEGQKPNFNELKIQYGDYAKWQKSWLKGNILDKYLEYWKKQLLDMPSLLELPTDKHRPPIQTYNGESFELEINLECTKKIKEFCQKSKNTLFTFLFTVFTVLLFRNSGQNDIIVGSPVANRSHKEIESLVGFFVNMLVLRLNVSCEETFNNLLEHARNMITSAYSYQDMPFETLVKEIQPERNLSYSPLFQVTFELQNVPIDELILPGLSIQPLKSEMTVAKYDLSLVTSDTATGLKCSFKYNTDLYEKSTIARMANHFENILESIIDNPERSIGELELLSDEERDQLLISFNATKKEWKRDRVIHQIFEAQVEKTPTNTMVMYNNKSMSYKSLNSKANSLARTLRKMGVCADSIVGIMIEPSFDMIIAIVAILKAGGAYLPLDPEYPKNRLEYIIKDSSINILLTKSQISSRVSFSGEVVKVDDNEVYHEDDSNLKNINKPEDLAYIIYTSGSTGQPKGVMVEHRNVLAYIEAFKNEFKVTYKDLMLQQASYAFDVFVEEFFPFILSGAGVVVCDREDVKNVDILLKIIVNQKVTMISCSPLLLNELNKRGVLGNVHTFISGGDVLRKEYISNLLKNANVYNTYGPTETTVCATYQKCNNYLDSDIPIGKPVVNYNVYVLDKNGGLLPIGIPGEICISGEGVSRGYINSKEVTAEKFVKNPYKPGLKMYKTGDIGRWLPDGSICFLGRKDNQVKIRGYRIEIEEIESQILNSGFVKEVAVVVREKSNGNKCLCAYLIPNKKVTLSELREYLSGVLPEYMIPSDFFEIDKMPLTVTGKIDRKSLPKLEKLLDTGIQFIGPRNKNEEIIALIWEKVLDIKNISMNDNFFHIGGDSILSISIVSQCTEKRVKLTTLDIFKYPTIEQLAEVAKSREAEHNEDNVCLPEKFEDDDCTICLIADEVDRERIKNMLEEEPSIGEVYPLSSMQLAVLNNYLLFSKLKQNVSILSCEINDDVDVPAFRKACEMVIQKHPILRTAFIWKKLKEPIQILYKRVNLPFIEMDWSDLNKTQQEKALKKYIKDEQEKGFNIREAPLLRIMIAKLNYNKYFLVWSYMNSLFDGWSSNIIINDLLTINQPNRSNHSHFAEEGFLFINYIKWIKSHKDETAKLFWKQELNGYSYNQESVAVESFYKISSLNRKTLKITASLMNDIECNARKNGLTINTILTGCWALLVSKFYKTNDTLLGIITSGRPAILSGIENGVGLFVNTLPLRININKCISIIEWLKELQEKIVNIRQYEHVSLQKIAAWCNLPIQVLQDCIYERLLVHSNFPIDFEYKHRTIKPLSVKGYGGINTPLRIYINSGSINSISIKYNKELISDKQVTFYLKGFEKLLKNLLEFGQPLDSLMQYID